MITFVVGLTAGLSVIGADLFLGRFSQTIPLALAQKLRRDFRIFIPLCWLGAHLWFVLVEDRGRLTENLIGGLSVYGCLLVTLAFVGYEVIAMRPHSLAAIDALAATAVASESVARIGCAIALDHPGREIAPGVPHNLGLYELGWSLTLAFMAMFRGRAVPGFFTALALGSYAALRLGLDHFRETPMRSTPLVASSLTVCAVGFVAAALMRQKAR